MIFPSPKALKDFVETIKKLKDIENSRDPLDSELFNKLYNKTITPKELLLKLKEKKLLSSSKKKDAEAIVKLIEYNHIFSKLTKELSLADFPIYDIKGKSFISKLLHPPKEEPKVTKKVKQTVDKKALKGEIITKPEIVPEPKKSLINFDFIKNLFNSKPEIKIKQVRADIKQITPAFEPPKELKPENYQILIPGFAYAFVDEEKEERVYTVAEPELNAYEKKVLEETKNALINKISLADLSNEMQMYSLIDKIFLKNKVILNKSQKDKIVYYIIRQVSGLDKIEPLMHDNLIEDIECDGTNIPIFIVHRKYGHIVTNIKFETENELQQFVIKMAHLCKSYVSYASPLLDAILPDGSRVNAILTSNVATRGPTFTIRKFPQKPLTTIDIVNSGTVTSEVVAYLWTLLEFKKNMIFIGPTAGGKTTLLNVVSSFIPSAQRVVSIEDTREINLLMENWIPQITRPGFGPPDSSGKKYGEVTMNDLLKESFRQRPDYLIIGEVRGEEMALMFQGMASGHCSLSTVHAKSVESLVTRLTTPPISLDMSLLTSLDIVVVTGFAGIGEGRREVKEIDEIRGYNAKDKKIEYDAVYKSINKYKEKGATMESDLFTSKLPLIYNSEILKEIAIEYNVNRNKLMEIITNRKNFIEDLTKKPPKDYIEFKKLLTAYKKTESF
ncbi:MAG: type II/IV secretion system ATPase subunit [archaeon]|nr:type II/IV secretion system ATPase subunit [archaeon]MDD2477889.1 type II/IV secretion system ATPase subunit [Candidatus ainarchaeum sp.]